MRNHAQQFVIIPLIVNKQDRHSSHLVVVLGTVGPLASQRALEHGVVLGAARHGLAHVELLLQVQQPVAAVVSEVVVELRKNYVR